MTNVVGMTRNESSTGILDKNSDTSQHKELKKKKKKSKAVVPIIVAVVAAFLIFVVFFWKNFSQKKELLSDRVGAVANSTENAAQEQELAQAEALNKQREEYNAYFANLRTEKESLLQQLNANYEEAKKNKELFIQINQETDEESIEASFQLKDERDKQRVRTVEHNKTLLEQRNNLVKRLEQIDQLLQQEQVTHT